MTQSQYSSHAFSYFAFHGSPGMVHIGRSRVTLDDLADELAGRCAGRSLYFASCGVLNIPKREIEAFRAATKARCVIGYSEAVDWYESSGFELMMLGAFSRHQRLDAIERYLTVRNKNLAKHLGFQMHYGA